MYEFKHFYKIIEEEITNGAWDTLKKLYGGDVKQNKVAGIKKEI